MEKRGKYIENVTVRACFTLYSEIIGNRLIIDCLISNAYVSVSSYHDKQGAPGDTQLFW